MPRPTKGDPETRIVSVRMPIKILSKIDQIISDGYSASRTEYIRTTVIKSIVENEKVH